MMDELAELEALAASGRKTTEVLERALDALSRSLRDSLTGLLDRRAFRRELERQLARGRPVGLLVARLPGIEDLSREEGPAAAEEALLEAARRVRSANAVAGRLGAGELALATEVSSRRDLDPLAGDLRQLGLEVAIAFSPADGRDARSLLEKAGGTGPLDALDESDAWRTHRNLRALADLVRASASDVPFDELARRILASLVESTGTERALLLEGDAEGGALSVRLAVDSAGSVVSDPGPWSKSLPHEVHATGRPQTRVVSADLSPGQMASSAGHLGLRAVMAVPLVAGGRPLGVLYVDSRESVRRFDATDLALFEALATQAALALERARAEEERRRRLEEENRRLAEALSGGDAVVGESPALASLVANLRRVAPSDVTVTLQGESGTGKGRLARFIHALSPRRAGPFVEIDLGAIPETLLESELFGHAEGAFTGAGAASDGLLAAGDGGTVLLDRVSEMPLALQGKLLRFLETKEVRPVGSTSTRRVDVRVLASTQHDLGERAARSAFREDLFYRLHVVRLRVPPLRERSQDVLLLARHFLGRLASETGRRPIELTEDAERALLSHDWPGNIRELRNRLHRAVVLASSDRLDPEDIELESEAPLSPFKEARRHAIEAFEEGYVRRALESQDWNVAATARVLGLARQNLYKLITRYRIERP